MIEFVRRDMREHGAKGQSSTTMNHDIFENIRMPASRWDTVWRQCSMHSTDDNIVINSSQETDPTGTLRPTTSTCSLYYITRSTAHTYVNNSTNSNGSHSCEFHDTKAEVERSRSQYDTDSKPKHSSDEQLRELCNNDPLPLLRSIEMTVRCRQLNCY
jgi:hypothetical protein